MDEILKSGDLPNLTKVHKQEVSWCISCQIPKKYRDHCFNGVRLSYGHNLLLHIAMRRWRAPRVVVLKLDSMMMIKATLSAVNVSRAVKLSYELHMKLL